MHYRVMAPAAGPVPSSGSISLIFGPMFSGKSTELLRRVRRYSVANHRCLLIKYKADTRYSDENLSTHDRCKTPYCCPRCQLDQMLVLRRTMMRAAPCHTLSELHGIHKLYAQRLLAVGLPRSVRRHGPRVQA